MSEKNNILDQVKEKILSSENILVALSKDPSVDEMAAAIGLTMLLDRAGKHATAIYSGKTPNAIQFLKPENTFESDTNSLQDFIIALNKEKADHLRYKVEGEYVRVYITPYKTRISEKDLEFSHGDFNVDLVIALNIDRAEHLDAALSEYGRIMHDATAVNITTGEAGNFADTLWADPSKSSVSEMLVGLVSSMKEVKMEKDIATALLTGIVAATDRFSNDLTTPETMSVAAELMKAGADQKLIADNVALSGESQAPTPPEKPEDNGGNLEIERDENEPAPEAKPTESTGPEELTIQKTEPSPEPAATTEPHPPEVSPSDVESATAELEQIIAPPAEDTALEQLRQVANDVKPPEFHPGENPAEIVAPKIEEKEANNIPVMNFGGGDVVNLVPPSEQPKAESTPPPDSLAAPSGNAPTPPPSDNLAPAPEFPADQPDELPPVSLDDIELPPPPVPPVDIDSGVLPQDAPSEAPSATPPDAPEVPAIIIKDAPTLAEETQTPASESAPNPESTPESESTSNPESAPESEPLLNPEPAPEATLKPEITPEDPSAFKIPGV